MLAVATLDSAEGSLTKAEYDLRRILERYPNDAKVMQLLAENLDDQGKTAAAIELYQRVVQINPNSADAYNDLGLALQKHGEASAAAPQYRKALELNPQLTEAHINLGNVFLAQKDFAQSQAEYQQAISMNPNNVLGPLQFRPGLYRSKQPQSGHARVQSSHYS